jgi:hypothetical protein
MASYPVTFGAFSMCIFIVVHERPIYEFITQSLFADLRFASIDYGKTNESGGKVRL